MWSCKWPGVIIVNSARQASRKLSSSHWIASHTCGIKHLTRVSALCCCVWRCCNSWISTCCHWIGVSSDTLNSAIRHTVIVITSGQASVSGRQTHEKRPLSSWAELKTCSSILVNFASSFVPCKTLRILVLLWLITFFNWFRRDFSKGSQLWH